MIKDNRPVRVFRTHLTEDFFIYARATAQDDNLSYAALGVLTYLLSKPETWESNVTDVSKRPTSSEYEAYKTFRELRKQGYMHLSKEKGKGKASRWVYDVFNISQLGELQLVENQLVEIQHTKRIQTPKKTRESKENKDSSDAVASGEKSRQPDLIFDAVLAGEGAGASKARVAAIANWLKGKNEGTKSYNAGFISTPATVELIERFFKDWSTKKDSDGKPLHPPLVFEKFVRAWRNWASAINEANRAKSVTASTSKPALTSSPIDEEE